MKKSGIVLVFILLVSVFSANALLASISKPKMVLYIDFDGNPLTIDESVIVNNPNSIDIKIKITPSEDFEGLVEIPETEFILKPDERKEVPYVITIKEPKTYNGKMIVYFNDANNPSVPGAALVQTVKIIVTNKGNETIVEPVNTPVTTAQPAVNQPNTNQPAQPAPTQNQATGEVVKEGKDKSSLIGLLVTVLTIVTGLIVVYAYITISRGGKNEK